MLLEGEPYTSGGSERIVTPLRAKKLATGFVPTLTPDSSKRR
jgi:hypothetical protein